MTTTIRGSSMARFMSCNGHLNFKIQEEESDYAREGTAAHEYLEQLFKGGPTIAQASNGVQIDDDMRAFAEKYLDIIPAHALSESEINFNVATGVDVKGHVDYHWITDNKLYVMDYKYGHRLVEVEDNWQLITYAIGLLFTYQQQFEKIVLMVVQPRAHHMDGPVRSVTTTVAELEQKFNQIRAQAEKYVSGPTLATSKNCRYCPAAREACPAFNAAFHNAIDYVKDITVPDSISNESLSQMLKTYERIADIFKIKSDALKDLAKERLLANETIPGFLAVKQYGNRKWVKDLKPETFKAMTGFDMMKSVVKSPLDLQKEKIDESILEAFVEKEFKGYKIEQVDTSKLGDQIFGNPNT